MSQNSPVNIKDLTPALDTLLSRAKHYGASQVDAVATHGCSLSVSVRDGELEDVDNSEGRDVGLRVLIGQRQACVSSSDLSENSLDLLAERCVAMAKLAPIDPYCGLALPEDIVKNAPDLDLFDSSLSSPQFLKDRAHALEGAVMKAQVRTGPNLRFILKPQMGSLMGGLHHDTACLSLRLRKKTALWNAIPIMTARAGLMI